MYGGCALSMEQSEAPPKAAGDSRVGCASGLALRALLAADGVGAVAPVASGFASSLVAPPPLWMLRPDGAAGRWGVGAFAVWLPLAPRMLWVVRCHEGGGVVVGGSRCSAAQGLRVRGRFGAGRRRRGCGR